MLRNQGHDVKDIKEMRLYGESDESIISLAQRENRILVTLDKNFGNIIVYPPEKYPGIIVLKVHPSSIFQTTYLLKKVITSNPLSLCFLAFLNSFPSPHNLHRLYQNNKVQPEGPVTNIILLQP